MESQHQNSESGIILKTFTHVMMIIFLVIDENGVDHNKHDNDKYIGDNDDLNVDDHVNETEKYDTDYNGVGDHDVNDTDYNDVGDHDVNDTDDYDVNEKQ